MKRNANAMNVIMMMARKTLEMWKKATKDKIWMQ